MRDLGRACPGTLRRMQRLCVAAVATVGLLSSSFAAATEAAITVEGNHRLGADSVKAFFQNSSSLTDADLDAALKAMYCSGEFAKVTIRRDGGAVHVRVDENPVIARVL